MVVGSTGRNRGRCWPMTAVLGEEHGELMWCFGARNTSMIMLAAERRVEVVDVCSDMPLYSCRCWRRYRRDSRDGPCCRRDLASLSFLSQFALSSPVSSRSGVL